MKINLVDYILSRGGGERFVVQLAKAILSLDASIEMTVVSHGNALRRYRALFTQNGVRCAFVDLRPRHNMFGAFKGYDVPPEAVAGCDVAWFPWLHAHRIPVTSQDNIVGTFHDGIAYTDPQWRSNYPAGAKEDLKTVQQWLAAPRKIVCSSHYWAEFLTTRHHDVRERLTVVPLTGDHMAVAARPVDTKKWPWFSSPFLLCPAGLSYHKNHGVLLEGFARAKLAWPLVLTGAGADLLPEQPIWRRTVRSVAVIGRLRPEHRGKTVRKQASRLGLTLGKSLIPLGFVTDAEYDAILADAACVIMPTLAEGGGSFPIEEAILRGVPVICSDIPVLREQVARLGAEIIWFDPHSPSALAQCLVSLRDNREAIKQIAVAAAGRVSRRQWTHVAREYLRVLIRKDPPKGSESELP